MPALTAPDSADATAPVPFETAPHAQVTTDPAGSVANAVATAATASTQPVPASGQNILRDGETQFQALYNFFNETIRNVIGLRGFTMQLKVERASTIADFRALRQSYLEAVRKTKGAEMERSLRDRLDQLLSVGD
jgi:hypothetical protein